MLGGDYGPLDHCRDGVREKDGYLAVHQPLVRHVERDSEVSGGLRFVDAASACALVTPDPGTYMCVRARVYHVEFIVEQVECMQTNACVISH